MDGRKRSWMCLMAALLLMLAACTNDSLDDGDGPDVVLEIDSLENQPVTAQSTTGGCAFEVTSWTGQASNVPLSAVAVGFPFNDIVLESVTVAYNWIDGVASTPIRTIGLGDVTIPANGTNSFRFEPISFQDLAPIAALGGGVTANLDMIFTARTIENERIRANVSRQLFVESCGGP